MARNGAPKLLTMFVSFKLGHGHLKTPDIVVEDVNSDSVDQAKGRKRRADELCQNRYCFNLSMSYFF